MRRRFVPTVSSISAITLLLCAPDAAAARGLSDIHRPQVDVAAAAGASEAVDAARHTRAVERGGDHPLVRPYAGSTLRTAERQVVEFDEYDRIIGLAGRRTKVDRVEGRVTRLVYDNPSGRSTLEIIRNYRDALVADGMKVDYECQGQSECGILGEDGRNWTRINGMDVGVSNRNNLRYLTGTIRHDGAEAYVSIAVVQQRHYVHVVEAVPMETAMVEVNAQALATDLERDGRVEVQGIYFETGSAALTPRSEPALEQVARMLAEQPGLQLSVVGHTDDAGTAALNLRLSQDRAEAVRAALVQRHGIEPSRLRAEGLGSSMPVASNDSAAGRASNRRVELVK